MASNPVNAYRGQQGLAPVVGGFHPDARVLDWIVKASAETHADPIALLATALQESGGKLHGPAGDGGTSFGPFQFHIGGALGNHPPAWASTYAAVLNRAQEFARDNVHGGPGAAAVQRPRDRQLYAAGVNSLLPTARQLLGQIHVPAAETTPDGKPKAPRGKLPDLTPIERLAGSDPMAQVKYLETILNPRASVDDLLGLVQQPQVDSPPLGGSAVSPPSGGATPKTKPTPSVPAATDHRAANFEGTMVAAWMVPALQFARANGWKGKLTSGVRSTAEQKTLYARYQAGGNIAAKPGQSNHELQNGGAFDATDAPQLNQILQGYKGKRPIWAKSVGLDDTPHFSLTGH